MVRRSFKDQEILKPIVTEPKPNRAEPWQHYTQPRPAKGHEVGEQNGPFSENATRSPFFG